MLKGAKAIRWSALLAIGFAFSLAWGGWLHHCGDHQLAAGSSATERWVEDCAICHFQALPFIAGSLHAPEWRPAAIAIAWHDLVPEPLALTVPLPPARGPPSLA